MHGLGEILVTEAVVFAKKGTCNVQRTRYLCFVRLPRVYRNRLGMVARAVWRAFDGLSLSNGSVRKHLPLLVQIWVFGIFEGGGVCSTYEFPFLMFENRAPRALTG